MKNCEECKEKQRRIVQLEGMIARMHISAAETGQRISVLNTPEFKTNGRPFRYRVIRGGKIV